MNKKSIFLSFIFPFFFSFLKAQQWINYSNSDLVYTIAFDEKYAWLCSSGGVIQTDLEGQLLKSFTRDDGLPFNEITDVAIDSLGNKWFTTYGGVAMYNGSNWKVFTQNNSGLLDDIVYCVCIDKKGILWFGTSKGLSRFDGTVWTSYQNIVPSYTSVEVRALQTDSLNTLWVGANFYGEAYVYTLSGKKWTNIPIDKRAGTLFSIAIEKTGNVWIGCFDGLHKWNGTTFINTGLVDNPGPIEKIVVDKEGKVWASAWASKLYVCTEGVWTFYDYTNSKIKNEALYSLAIDSKNRKWLGGGMGLQIFDAPNWKSISYKENGLLANFLHFVFADSKGAIWSGSDMDGSRGGVNSFITSIWKSYNSILTPDLKGGNYYDATEDKQNRTWVATNLGISVYNGTSWKNHSHGSDFRTSVAKLTVDANNQIWCATSYGLKKLDPLTGSWTVYNQNNSPLPDSVINTVMADKQGKIWIGTSKGLTRFDGINWFTFTTENSKLGNNNVYSLAVDSQNKLWVPTVAGLNTFDGQTWSLYTSVGSYTFVNTIGPVAVDSAGIVWICGYGSNAGLLRTDLSHIEFFTLANSGIASNLINSISIDKKGNKWLATNDGLCVYNEGGVHLPLGLSSSSLSPTLMLYPNPARESTQVQFPADIDDISIYSLEGGIESLPLITQSATTVIDLSSLKKGVYIVKAQTKGMVTTTKLVVNH